MDFAVRLNGMRMKGHMAEPKTLTSNQVITIEPSKGWLGINLGELWHYRELIYFLTWRDIKVRYKQAALGIAWAILQPVLTTLITSIVFGYLLKVDPGDMTFPVFTLAGGQRQSDHQGLLPPLDDPAFIGFSSTG